MWYGSSTPSSSLRSITNQKNHNTRQSKNDKINFKKSVILPNKNWLFSFLPTWRVVILASKVHHIGAFLFYLYNQTYYFTFWSATNVDSVYVNKTTNTLMVKNSFQDPLYPLYNSLVQILFYSVSSVFFLKIRFKGKGYYVYKNARNTIAPQFGYAHRIYVYAYFISLKFLSKTTILLFGFSKADILSLGYDFKSKKPINIFTGRGVRFARQVIYSKVGKVSSYR